MQDGPLPEGRDGAGDEGAGSDAAGDGKAADLGAGALGPALTMVQAAEILGMSERQLRRWHRGYEKYGYDGLNLRPVIRCPHSFTGSCSEPEKQQSM